MNSASRYYYLLAAGISIIVTMVAVGVVIFEAGRSTDRVFSEGERQGNFLFTTLSQQVSDSLYFNDVEQIREDAELLAAQGEVGKVAIFNAEGIYLFDSDQPMVPEGQFDAALYQMARTNSEPLHRRVSDGIEFVGAIRFDGVMIGGLYFKMDLRQLLADSRQWLVTVSAVSAFVVLLLIGLIFALAQFFSTRRSLQQLEQNFQALIEQSPLPYGVFHRNGEMSFANPAMWALIGGLDSTATRRRNYNVLKDPLIKKAGVLEAFEKGFREGPVDIPPYRYEVPSSDGEDRSLYLKGVVFPLQSNDKSIGEVAFAFEDITAEAKADQHKEELNRMLLQSQKLEGLGQMARGIAHDFNNLLTPVMASADLLSRRIETDSQGQAFLQNIIRGARKASELCTQLLTYGRNEQGVREPTDLSKEVGEIQELISSSVSKNVVLSRQLEDGLPAIEVDRSLIRQVILNLLINASEATEEGHGEVRLTTGLRRLEAGDMVRMLPDPELPAGDYVYLQVADTGMGMGEETLRNLFDPFFSTKFTGRGLGMSVVLGIVGDHDGGIIVSSEEGIGTEVTVYFAAAGGLIEQDNQAAVPRDKSSVLPGSGKILLADDEPGVLEINRQLLDTMNFETVTAINGAEAVERYREDPDSFCCAVLDLMMPVLDGEGAVRELRKLNPDLPVVIVTGLKKGGAFDRLSKVPNLKIVSKPYLIGDLQEAIAEALS